MTCRERAARFAAAVQPLPGSVPRDNPRTMSVPGRHDGRILAEFFASAHPHVPASSWQARLEAGLLSVDGRPVRSLDEVVRAGNKIVNMIRADVEPDVAVDVTFLYEDDCLLVLRKPAPLPMHPCGRFNRNSLVPLLTRAFAETFLPVHRLDADTTGVVVLAKTAAAAHPLAAQFERRRVGKRYLARVHGLPQSPSFVCEAPLERGPGDAGRRRTTSDGTAGFTARTRFSVLHSSADETLLAVEPSSGRTNQIRVHLASLGLPIVGDQAYSGDEAFISGRSTLCLHAWQLSFRHPLTDQPLAFEAAWPSWASFGGR